MTTSVFAAAIKMRGVNPFILVSARRASAIKPGWRKPLPVLVRINGEPAEAWRINMMPAGDGSFYLYLHGDIRKASGTAVGDRVRVEIDFDASYKTALNIPCPGGSSRHSPGIRRHEELDRTNPEPQEGDTPLLLTPQLAGRSCPEPCESPPRAFRRNRPIHGARVEERIVGAPNGCHLQTNCSLQD